jgi:translocation and assembly module TamB
VTRLLTGLLLYAVLAVASVTLVASEAGLRWAWAVATPFLPAGLSLAQINGRLIGPIRVEDLRYHDQDRRLWLRQAEWDWRPWRLASGVLDVTRLRVEGLQYTVLSVDPGVPPLPDSLQPGVDLSLRDVLLLDIHYAASPQAVPIVIDRLGFSTHSGVLGQQLKDLQLQAGNFQASGEGRIRLRGDYPIRAGLQAQWTGGQTTQWKGTADLQGSLRQLEFTLALESPQPAQLSGQMRWIDQRIELTGTVGTQAAGDWLRWMKLPAGEASSLQGRFKSRLEGEQLHLERAQINLPAEGMEITLKGEADLDTGRPQSSLHIEWQGVRWPLQAEPRLRSPAGQLQFSGNPDKYQIQAQATIEASGVVAEALSLAATGDRNGLQLEALQAKIAGGDITGHGKLVWSGTPSLKLALAGKGINPAQLHPDWPGRLSFEGRAAAQWPEHGLEAQLQQLLARGQLRGRALSLNAQARLSGADWDIQRAVLRAGATQLSLQGRYGQKNDLHASLDSPDIADLLPHASGRIQGSAQWQGAAGQSRLSTRIRGEHLRYAENHLAELAVDAKVDTATAGELQLALQLRDGDVAGVALQSMSLSASGSKAAHATQLQLKSELGEFDLQGTGQWLGGLAWQAQWQHSELRPAGAGRWQLTEPTQLYLSRTRATLGASCWADEAARACLQGDWSPEATTATVELRQLPTALLRPVLPAGVSVQGLLDADVSLQREANAAMRANAVIAYGGGEISYQPAGARNVRLRLNASHADVQLAENALDLNGEVNLAEQGQLVVALQLPWPLSPQTPAAPLKGRIRADLPQLGFLSPLLPELDEISGYARGELQLAGTVAEPRGIGSLKIDNAVLRADRLGLQLEDLSAVLRSDGSDRLWLEASARSGGGDLTLTAISQGGLALTRMEATLRGSDVLVYNNADARVYLSPDLQATLKEREININGILHVPRAEITPREYAQTGAVTTSADEVIVSAQDPAKDALAGWRVHSRLRLKLGKDVRFDGLGLKGTLAGELQLRDRPGELTTAKGELRVLEGTYLAYGQVLDITTGRLLFNGGPVMEPALDIRAERKPAENVLVGVQLRGPLKSPTVNLFSDPPMSDSQRLSYLMFGTPMDSGDGARSAAIAQAAYTLGAAGTGGFLQQIGTQLGADEFKIQSDPGSGLSGSRLVIGKYLSPKLYISYGVGMFDAVRTLRLRYKLSRRWALETESGEHSGGDLLYSIER